MIFFAENSVIKSRFMRAQTVSQQKRGVTLQPRRAHINTVISFRDSNAKWLADVVHLVFLRAACRDRRRTEAVSIDESEVLVLLYSGSHRSNPQS